MSNFCEYLPFTAIYCHYIQLPIATIFWYNHYYPYYKFATIL